MSDLSNGLRRYVRVKEWDAFLWFQQRKFIHRLINGHKMIKSVIVVFKVEEYTDFEQLSKHGMRPPKQKNQPFDWFFRGAAPRVLMQCSLGLKWLYCLTAST